VRGCFLLHGGPCPVDTILCLVYPVLARRRKKEKRKKKKEKRKAAYVDTVTSKDSFFLSAKPELVTQHAVVVSRREALRPRKLGDGTQGRTRTGSHAATNAGAAAEGADVDAEVEQRRRQAISLGPSSSKPHGQRGSDAALAIQLASPFLVVCSPSPPARSPFSHSTHPSTPPNSPPHVPVHPHLHSPPHTPPP